MKHKLRYSPESLRDLEEIHEHILEEPRNPDAASSLITDILDAAERLEDFPESGAPLSSITDVPNDYRFIPVPNHMILYRAQQPNVFIDRILYTRRDYMRVLFEK
jgi:plasmid stabilization system protein ParE